MEGDVRIRNIEEADYRRCNAAKSLYSLFFDYCKERGVKYVKCITSPVNKVSIAFHQRLGFKVTSCDSQGNPVPIQNYDGPGEHRVVFKMRLTPQHDASTPDTGEMNGSGTE